MTFKRVFTAAAIVATVCLVAVCGIAKASVFPVEDAQVVGPPLKAVPVYKPDLVVTSVNSTGIVIKNLGLKSAGPFSVRVSQGYVGDQCQWTIPALFRSYAGLGTGQSVFISLKDAQSSIDRTVTADYLNQVAESNEQNNRATVPGAPIVC